MAWLAGRRAVVRVMPLPLRFLRGGEGTVYRGERLGGRDHRERPQQQALRPRALEEVMPSPVRRILRGDQAARDALALRRRLQQRVEVRLTELDLEHVVLHTPLRRRRSAANTPPQTRCSWKVRPS